MTSSGSGPTGGGGRSVTRMPDVTSRRVNDKPVTMEFDPRTFVPIGAHAASFRSYLGVIGKYHVPIVATCWDDVPQNDTPCTKYKIIEEEWVQFKESRLTPEWQLKRIAAQHRQKLSDTPHVLSRGGYALLEKKMRKRRAEELGLESPNLAPPPARHELWKDDLVDQQTQGTFVAQGRENLLVAAKGCLDRPGRVHAVGGATALRDYFGPKPRSTEA
ncbi:hypothetical protein LR48_Vigan02g059400 [Vigna angularis]|uniref:Uncharacterized protein n=1 Tax=Phaseolus angularis TaxID=3914 RepID=A0A0L9TWB3_PHAAN|nr:hypothetical protein LR48_Vigan02g059400 [Vigna angularis]